VYSGLRFLSPKVDRKDGKVGVERKAAFGFRHAGAMAGARGVGRNSNDRWTAEEDAAPRTAGERKIKYLDRRGIS
jgi:hypothetical protein